jgi:YXWGXW repeat-containing protein
MNAKRNVAALALVAAIAGCYGRAYGTAGVVAPSAEVTIESAPPPMRHEVVVASPGPGFVWVAGYWDWDGATYLWVPGSWVTVDAGYTWVRPRYVRRGGGWVYVRGYYYHRARGERVYDRGAFHARPVRAEESRGREHEHGHGRGHDRGRHLGERERGS